VDDHGGPVGVAIGGQAGAGQLHQGIGGPDLVELVDPGDRVRLLLLGQAVEGGHHDRPVGIGQAPRQP